MQNGRIRPSTPTGDLPDPHGSARRLDRFVGVLRGNIPLLAICAVVLVARLALVGYMHAADSRRFVDIDPDSRQYEQLALTMLDTGTFTNPNSATGEPEVLRTPGYPAFIAAIYSVFGARPVAVIVVQTLLATGVLVAVYALTATLFTPRAALFAAAVTALDPLHTDLSALLMTDSIGTLLSVLACLLVVVLVTKHRSPWVALACGATLAVATMVRPVSYYLIGAIAVGLLVVHRAAGFNPRRVAAVIVALLLPAVVILGSWHLRNLSVVGTAQFSGIAGRNLLQYRAAGIYAMRHGVGRKQAVAVLRERMLAETDTTKPMFERQMDFAKRYMVSDIPGTARLAVFGAARLLLDPGGAEILKLLGAEPVPGTQGLTNAMSASFTAYLARWSGGNPWAAAVILATLAFLALFYLFTAMGLVRWFAGPRDHVVAHLFVWGFLLYYLLLSAGGEGLARLRAPFAPMMAVYAGAGLAWLYGRIGERRTAGASRWSDRNVPAGI